MQSLFNRLFFLAGILALALILSFCSNEEELTPREYPTVNTISSKNISPNGVEVFGEILTLGSEEIQDHGFVYVYELWDNQVKYERSNVLSLGPTNNPSRFQGIITNGLIKGFKYKYRAFVQTEFQVVYGQIYDFESQTDSDFEIIDVVPSTAVVGDTLAIVGKGFNSANYFSEVTLGEESIRVFNARNDTLYIRAEPSLEAGLLDLSVTINNISKTLPEAFSLVQPEITSYTPEEVSFGDTLRINGSNFSQQLGLNEVRIFGVKTPVIRGSNDFLDVTIPQRIDTMQSPIKLLLGKQSTETDVIRLKQPTIIDFSPKSGGPGTIVYIQGLNFSQFNEDHIVSIGGVEMEIIDPPPARPNEWLRVKISGELRTGEYPIQLSLKGLPPVITQDTYIREGATITAVSSLRGTWRDEIRIEGINLTNNNEFWFGNTRAEVLTRTSTEVTVKVPDNLAEDFSEITVRGPEKSDIQDGFPEKFELIEPEITRFTIERSGSLRYIIITGKNFHPISYYHKLYLGNRLLTVESSSRESLAARLPELNEDMDVPVRVKVGPFTVYSDANFVFNYPWKRLADLPEPTSWSTAYEVNGKSFVVGGSAGKIFQYFFTKDEWKTIGTAPRERGSLNWVFGNSFYYGLGSPIEDGTKTNPPKIQKFDIVSRTWTEVNTPPALERGYGTSFQLNGKGYVYGGVLPEGKSETGIWEFDPVTEEWRNIEGFPIDGLKGAVSFINGNSAYMIGGVPEEYVGLPADLTYQTRPIQKWDQPDESGEVFDEVKYYSNYGSSAVSYEYGALVIGGFERYRGYSSHLTYYTLLSKRYISKRSLPADGRMAAIIFTRNSKIYYGTGVNNNGEYADFWVYDPDEDK